MDFAGVRGGPKETAPGEQHTAGQAGGRWRGGWACLQPAGGEGRSQGPRGQGGREKQCYGQPWQE